MIQAGRRQPPLELGWLDIPVLCKRKLFISEEQAFRTCQRDCWVEGAFAEPLNDGDIGLLQIPKQYWTKYPEVEHGLKHTSGLLGVIHLDRKTIFFLSGAW